MIKYRERRIRRPGELKRVLEGLDPDEGVRIIGSLSGKDVFIFITRSSNEYCVNLCDQVYDKDLEAIVPGGREEWLHASTPDEVWDLIASRIKKPLEAWIY